MGGNKTMFAQAMKAGLSPDDLITFRGKQIPLLVYACECNQPVIVDSALNAFVSTAMSLRDANATHAVTYWIKGVDRHIDKAKTAYFMLKELEDSIEEPGYDKN